VLGSDDLVLTTHRNHGHIVGRGADPARALAEILGRADGLNGGRGGSIHLCDRSLGFLQTSGIVGGVLPLAAGAALGLRQLGTRSVAVVFFGDGALEEGVAFESFNAAALWRLPVVFVCENNSRGALGQQAGGYPSAVSAVREFGSIPRCCGIATREFDDGADVAGIRAAAADAVERCRAGAGPAFIETRTVRWPGSNPLWPEPATGITDVTLAWRADAIAGPHAGWIRDHDPVLRFARELAQGGLVERAAILRLDEAVRTRMERAAAVAAASPLPEAATAFAHVFA